MRHFILGALALVLLAGRAAYATHNDVIALQVYDPLAGRAALPRSAQVQFALSHQHINADARCHRCPNAAGLCDPRA